MTEHLIQLTGWDLALATGLVLISGVVSLSLRLGLEKRLVVATIRTVVQLLLIGQVLKWVFAINHFLPLAGVLAIMFLVACREAVRRPGRTFRGSSLAALVTLTASGMLTSYAVTGVIIGCHPWYQPQYLIPLLGMILGNTLTGLSLCLDRILTTLSDRRGEIEMELAHGATRWEAARDAVADGVRSGMIPVINSMMVVGIVSLPGMMTGQILAGSDPAEAVRYQIVVMFMICAASAMSCIGMSLLTFRRLFNARHQLEAERILRRKQ